MVFREQYFDSPSASPSVGGVCFSAGSRRARNSAASLHAGAQFVKRWWSDFPSPCVNYETPTLLGIELLSELLPRLAPANGGFFLPAENPALTLQRYQVGTPKGKSRNRGWLNLRQLWCG